MISNNNKNISKILNAEFEKIISSYDEYSTFYYPLSNVFIHDLFIKVNHFLNLFYDTFPSIIKQIALSLGRNFENNIIIDYEIHGQIPEKRFTRIREVLDKLEHPEKGAKRIKPNWDEELKYILEGKGQPLPTTVVCDLYLEKDDKKYAFELKSPLPNSDITKVSKEKMFKLYSMVEQPVLGAFYALPYNPYGKRENYSWGFPFRWFDMKNDEVVMIGNEFWDFIGGEGSYQMFIEEINKLGEEYKERIYKEYLGINNELTNSFKLK